ncbi:YrhC family protein [Bacillus sp. CGMCC 1.16607]|uniref:YrhC family protein n=1 Tax=Bacillus sp. CGMCC 1.16607 TaxID=3351842 RepID=UPI003642D5A8
MKIEIKKIYEKMIDYHRFATVLLAVGVFFYLGTIIPNEMNTTVSQIAEMCGSIVFLAASILFFQLSKTLRIKLEETEDGQKYLTKK